MLNPEIVGYVSPKVKSKLEKKYKEIIKKKEDEEKNGESFSPTEEEKLIISRYENFDSNIEDECNAWIVNIAQKDAKQRKTATHVPKFMHPSIDIQFTNLIILPNPEADGYIKTSNVPEYLDSFGNAASIAASELMSLVIDEKPLCKHLREETDVGKEFIASFENENFPVVDSFLEMMKTSPSTTDSRTRQVFFPVGDGYHIITPLMSSPVMNTFVMVLNQNRKYNNNPIGSDSKNPPRAKDLENDGKFLEGGYWTLTNTVNINYGGKKPKNISCFNNKAKTIRLMKSLPPEIRRRKIRIPSVSFFTDSVYSKASRYSDLFLELDKIFKDEKKNIEARERRDKYLLGILQQIASDIAAVRYEISFKEGKHKGSLDSAEYIMLYEDEKRYEDDEWQKTISEKFSSWFFTTYKTIVDKPLSFGDAEYRNVRDYALSNKEVFIQ